jgi:hypothetical protein
MRIRPFIGVLGAGLAALLIDRAGILPEAAFRSYSSTSHDHVLAKELARERLNIFDGGREAERSAV